MITLIQEWIFILAISTALVSCREIEYIINGTNHLNLQLFNNRAIIPENVNISFSTRIETGETSCKNILELYLTRDTYPLTHAISLRYSILNHLRELLLIKIQADASVKLRMNPVEVTRSNRMEPATSWNLGRHSLLVTIMKVIGRIRHTLPKLKLV